MQTNGSLFDFMEGVGGVYDDTRLAMKESCVAFKRHAKVVVLCDLSAYRLNAMLSFCKSNVFNASLKLSLADLSIINF